MRNNMDLRVWIYSLVACINIVIGSECQFPADWRGFWQEGRSIEITANSMTRKGTCIQSEGTKYFMLNKDSSDQKCYKCLVITQWHHNLLQYKESNCWFEDDFATVCSRITGDAVLHTLVRAPSTPVPCPFQGSYTFSYFNGSQRSLPCDYPRSEVHACADPSKFKVVYKHCQGLPNTYNRESDFQCLATWENGEKYLYGSFSEPWMTSVTQYKYRCFMHSFYGSSGDMSMSADATCQGLQTPTLGVISMSFQKDMREPRGACRFPDVLVNRDQWRDMSGKWLLEVESGLQVLRLKDRASPGDITYISGPMGMDLSASRLVMRCVRNTDTAQTKDGHVMQTDFLTYVTDDNCESGYQCVRLVKRDENILELYLGSRVNDSSSCTGRHFQDSAKHLLIPDGNDSGQCSITRKGVYQFRDKASECTGTVNIGCTTPNKIIIDTKCRDRLGAAHVEKVEILDCLHSWSTNSKTYIIIQNEGQKAKCLTFYDSDVGVNLQSDEYCQSDRWTVDSKNINYLLNTPAESCNPAVPPDDVERNTERSDSRTDIKVQETDSTISNSVQTMASVSTVVLCNMLLYSLLSVR